MMAVTTQVVHPSGEEITYFPDGTIQKVQSGGEVIVEYAEDN